LRETISRYRETAAEFEQARTRFRRDVAKEVEHGKRAVLVELLDVVDNLDRALEAGRQSAQAGRLLEGVDMIRSQFLAKLGGFGVVPVAALGEVFDPHLHEAVTTVPVTDPAQDGRIVGVVRPGYRIGEDVLRPALVAVARLTAEETS
jgi:molecular chaperone GrpE